jgi:hypothetical protein
LVPKFIQITDRKNPPRGARARDEAIGLVWGDLENAMPYNRDRSFFDPLIGYRWVRGLPDSLMTGIWSTPNPAPGP